MFAYWVTESATSASEALRIEVYRQDRGDHHLPGLINTAIARTSVIRGDHADERAAGVARLMSVGYSPERAADNFCARRAATARSRRLRPKPTSCTR